MNSRLIPARFLVLAACGVILLAPRPLRAQQDAPPASGQTGDQGAATQEAGGQNAPGPVGGVESYRFPDVTSGHSFFVPRISVQEVYDTNPGFVSSTGASQGDSVTSVMGGFSLQLMSRNSTLSLDCSSEGLFYNPKYVSNATAQQLNVSEKISARHWNLLFGESFSYLPNSDFGLAGLGYLGGGLTGPSGIGVVTGFNPYQVPTQTIGSSNVSEFSSASIFQAQYLINGKNSLTASADVGFLHFFNSSMLNSRDILARLGYDHSFTRRDTLNLSYSATIIAYPSGIPGLTSHAVQLGYRRLVTNRLQLTIAGGPSLTQFSPLAGTTTVPGGRNLVGYSVLSSLNYALRKGNLGAQYTHSVGSGSGLLLGSLVDQFSGTFSHLISRAVRVTFAGSFAHNGAFQQTAGAAVNPSSAFDYWTGGAALSWPLGHYSSLSFTYSAARQTSNTTVCINMLSCGPIALTQVAGMTINWSTRPHKID